VVEVAEKIKVPEEKAVKVDKADKKVESEKVERLKAFDHETG
jgi:hypothetical protein